MAVPGSCFRHHSFRILDDEKDTMTQGMLDSISLSKGTLKLVQYPLPDTLFIALI